MLGRTHALGGFVAWEAVAPIVTHDWITTAVGAAFAVWGSYGPDMDHIHSTWSHSFIGGSKVAKWIGRAAGGHRMGTHSLISIPIVGMITFVFLFIAWLISPYDPIRAVDWSLAYSIGWASHILEDALTVQGVGVLYPFSRKRFRIGNLRTSQSRKKLNPGEAMVGFLLIITGAFLFLNLIGGQVEQAIGRPAVHSSTDVGGGHKTLPHRAP